MSGKPTSMRLMLLRGVVLVLALGAGSYLVAREQRRANPTEEPTAPARTEEPAVVEGLEEVDPTLLHSSKALAIENPDHPLYLFSSKNAAITPPEDVDAPEPDPTDPAFLFSSKSAAITDLAPEEPEETPRVFLPTSKSGSPVLLEGEEGAAEKPVFLPSSKWGNPQLLPSEEEGETDASEAKAGTESLEKDAQ